VAVRGARAGASDAGHRLLQWPIARCNPRALSQGIGGIGFRGGRNVAIEYRFADGQDERLSVLAAELVRRKVSMLVATDRPSAVAAKAATATIPIVFASGLDPVQIGLVASFNRPGGNATGVSLLTTELGPKRLGLLRELLPTPGTLAFVVNPNNTLTPFQVRECKTQRGLSDNRCSWSRPGMKSRSTKRLR
jgi:putative ABC transport system substrate-binding protein